MAVFILGEEDVKAVKTTLTSVCKDVNVHGKWWPEKLLLFPCGTTFLQFSYAHKAVRFSFLSCCSDVFMHRFVVWDRNVVCLGHRL